MAAAIFAIVLLGSLARLDDPMSSSVIPAEDPYTHMGLVRGHLSDGDLDPLVDDGTLYPPGMHAVLAATHAFTGLDLYSIFLYGPVLFGAIGIIAIATLLWRHAGPGAALVGAIATALAPELIFRTTMMAPTALDLAVLPIMLFAILETLRGRMAWVSVVAGMSLFFILAHPWVLAILAPVTLAIVVMSILFAGHSEVGDRMRPVGGALVLGSIGAALVLAVSVCWSQCGLGFQDINAGQSRLDQVGTAVGLACLTAAALLVVARRSLQRRMSSIRRPLPLGARIGMSAAAAAFVVGITIPAVSAGMPNHVDLPRMFGWPMLALGILGLVALPFLPKRAGWAGAAMVAVTYPFVIFNPLDSPFWPHRTAAFFGIGLVIMAGMGAAALFALGHRAVASASRERRAGHWVAGAGVTLMVGLATAGTVYAATPPDYESGWYRLYHECEFEALRDIADEADGDTIIITGDWRGKLVVGAFAEDAGDVWYSEAFFADPEYREQTVYGLALDGKDVLVLEDRHLIIEHRDLDRSFLHGDEWRPEGSYCSEGVAEARLNVYRSEVEP